MNILPLLYSPAEFANLTIEMVGDEILIWVRYEYETMYWVQTLGM